MPATTPRVETFEVIDDHLVRKVVPRRGEAYEHRCPLDAYRELAWAAIDLAADGFTVEGSTDRIVLTNPYEQTVVADIHFHYKRAPKAVKKLAAKDTKKRAAKADKKSDEKETTKAVRKKDEKAVKEPKKKREKPVQGTKKA